MAQTILLKRGVQTDIESLTLQYGEVALAYNADKTAIALYGGDGNGGLVLINPDVSGDIESLQSDVSSIQDTIDGIVSVGGEANVLETVKVNGTALEITDKAVDVTVPTAVSELTNDSGYQTATEVTTAIETAIAGTGHASFQTAASVPDAADAEENVLYLVMNSETGYYDIYALVSGSVVRIDDTSIDLSDYAKSADVTQEISDAVAAEASARESADTTLQNNIDSEASARESADKTLQDNIDTVSASVTSEASARESADEALQEAIDAKLGTTDTIDGGTF